MPVNFELYNSHLYLIRALENIHAGKGGTNLGTIDNLIQRDAADEFPCIHDSSLKGALKEYAEFKAETELIRFAFGNDDKNKGSFIFPQAYLLTMPVKSSHIPFYRATSIGILKAVIERCTLYDLLLPQLTSFYDAIKDKVESRRGVMFNNIGNTTHYFDDFTLTAKYVNCNEYNDAIKHFLGDDLVIFTDEDFKTLTDDHHLPVQPRNKLENGESKNLWYEQLLPRETRFIFTLFTPKTDTEFTESFESNFDKKVIQIGANASVGMGWSYIQKIESI